MCDIVYDVLNCPLCEAENKAEKLEDTIEFYDKLCQQLAGRLIALDQTKSVTEIVDKLTEDEYDEYFGPHLESLLRI
jgi:hypothetical protein